MMDKIKGWKEEAQGKRNQGRRTVSKAKSAKKHHTSALAIQYCKYTSKTRPKLWQDATTPAASFMNVTPREKNMITLERRRGGGTGGGGRKRGKKNHFDGLCPSWDNLVTFLDRILTHPDSRLEWWFPFFLPSPFVIRDVQWLWQLRRHWYLMIPLAGTNYYQRLSEETWFLSHMPSLVGGGF